ncbi:GNAT family N-acetyltransferase [Actinoplanes sp. NPDC023801]|uniref:GNAT family N-acetyltransferase n=1 Tax=Actinoplanes sp. NPDC023801 TaxID=3154595 RepID=UPI0034032F1D
MIELRFSASERSRVGELYWSAFGRKLRAAFPDAASGQAFVTDTLRSDRTLVARIDGEIAGICGFHENGHGAAGLSWRALRERFGTRTAIWASLVLAPLSRTERGGVLLLDGICVSPGLRGKGIGTALLTAAETHAAARGDAEVQLTVVDTNPRAEALYRRRGFRVVDEGSLGALGNLYGFQRYRTMRKRIGR